MSGTRGVVLRALKWLSAAVVFLLFGLCLWGLLIGPRRLVETREFGPVANLPGEWEGKRVAFIADLQIGMWWNNSETIEKAIELLVRERPDIMLIGGDFTENPAKYEDQISASVKMVAPLVKSGIRTFAVLGNHDYSIVEREDPKQGEPAERLSRELTKIGIVVLNNEARAVTLREGGLPVYVVGLGSHWADEDRAEKAMRDVPANAPRIVFMHNPDSFSSLPAYSAPLAICGHTHGGQIRLPFTPQWSWLTFHQEGKVHADGWQPNYGEMGNSLYVNRGLGMSVAPLRINASPEITWFALTFLARAKSGQ